MQRVLSGSTIAGELFGGDPRVPQVGVYLNDATGSKMSYYLRSKVRLKAESCAAGEQQLEGAADFSYTAKSPPVEELSESVTGPGTFGTPKGEQLVLVRIYGPKGGDLSNFRVAGAPTPGHPRRRSRAPGRHDCRAAATRRERSSELAGAHGSASGPTSQAERHPGHDIPGCGHANPDIVWHPDELPGAPLNARCRRARAGVRHAGDEVRLGRAGWA